MTTIKKICAAIAAAMLINSAAFAAENDSEPSEVNADAIEYDMKTERVTATGNVMIKHGEPKENNPPSELNADTVDYDMKSGLVTAIGNVLLKNGVTKATGLKAMFNVNTQEAHLIGNVIVVREDMRITCDALASDGKEQMYADGNVIATQTVAPSEKYPDGDKRTFTGDHIDYYPNDRKHVVIPGGGIAKSAVEGTFTADQMEGWIDDEHYVGNGNAHLISITRNLEAGGDKVDYSGKEEGKAVLSGNAWAVQDNNTIRGNRLTVYLADDNKLKAEKSDEPDKPGVTLEEFNKAFEATKNPKPAPKKSDTDEPAKEPAAETKPAEEPKSAEEATANES